MHWNHRVFRKKHPSGDVLGIHECFYDEDGKVNGWTLDAIAPQGDNLDELRVELERMLKCLDEPILDYSDEVGGD
jgi:hypothetical protein